MRRKRLNHMGNGIIGILQGYQIIFAYAYFHHHGPGVYRIDLLRKRTWFNDRDVESTAIFDFIMEWFDRELVQHLIDRQAILQADVEMTIKLSGYRVHYGTSTPIGRFLKLLGQMPISHETYSGRILVNLRTDEKDYSRRGFFEIYED